MNKFRFQLVEQISILSNSDEEVIIFFHGLGATNDDLVPVFQLMKSKFPQKNIGAVFVQAPIQPCKIFGGEPLPCWFDVESLEDIMSNNWIGLEEIVLSLVQLIKDIKSLYPNILKISLAGFSQGGVVAQKISEKISCDSLILMSTFAAQPISPMSIKKCFIGHGLMDQVVGIMYGRQLSQVMEERALSDGFVIKYQEYTFLPHSICPEEIDDIASFSFL